PEGDRARTRPSLRDGRCTRPGLAVLPRGLADPRAACDHPRARLALEPPEPDDRGAGGHRRGLAPAGRDHRLGRLHEHDAGPGRRAWPRDGGPPPPRGGPGPGPGHRPPPPPGSGGDPFAPDHRPGDGPPWGPPQEPSEHDAALLRSILTFYDRFAQRNAKEPR